MSGRLPDGLGNKERASLNSHFGVCCFDMREPNSFCSPSLWGEVRRGREGAQEPSASGSLVAGGGPSGWGPCNGFAGLAARLLPCGCPSQVTGDRAAGGLGDSECPGDSNTGAWISRKGSLPTSDSSRPWWWGMASPGHAALPREPSL